MHRSNPSAWGARCRTLNSFVAPYLHAWFYVSHCNDNGLNLLNYKPAPT